MKVIQERNVERIAVQKDHQKAIDNLRKEHKKELDVSVQPKCLKFLIDVAPFIQMITSFIILFVFYLGFSKEVFKCSC